MASIDFGSKSGSRPYGTLTVNISSQNIANNTTTVSYSLVLHRPSNISASAKKSWSCTINGVKHNGSGTIGGSGNKILLSGTQTITHNSDGTKSITFSASIGLSITWSDVSLGTISGSGSMTLTRIPRTSSFGTISGNTIGSGLTININRATTFTHTIQYKIGSMSWTNGITGAGTSGTFTLPMSLCNYLPSSTSGTLSLRLITYNGSTQIGYVDKTITVYVPSSVVPSISSISVSEATGGLATQFGGYVKNKSKLNITVNDSGSYSSSISSRRTTIQGVNYTSKTFASNLITSSGTITISTTVTDSRGRTATKSVNISVLDYYNPSISSLTVARCNSAGTLDDNGTHAKAVCTFNISQVNNKNTKSVVIQWLNGSTWTTLATYTDVYSGTKTLVTTQTFKEDSTFKFRAIASDYFTSSNSGEKELPTVFTLMNHNKSGHGYAIGQVSTKDAFQVALPTELNGNYALNGLLTSQMKRNNPMGSWISGRDNATIRNLQGSTGSWSPIASGKTPNGSWELGVLGETFYLSYSSDSNYNNGTNATTLISFDKNGNTSGLVVPWGNISGKPSLLPTSGGEINHIIIPNEGSSNEPYNRIMGRYTDGSTGLLASVSSGNNMVFGYGSFKKQNGFTHLYGKGVKFICGSPSSEATIFLEHASGNYNAFFRPTTNNKTTIGTTSYRFYGGYFGQACNTSSDVRLKDNIIPLDSELSMFLSGDNSNIFEKFFFKLIPKAYSLKMENSTEHEGRMHIGMIAQDVEKALNECNLNEKNVAYLTHSYWIDDKTGEEKDEYSLRYEEFIALNIHMIQKAHKKIDEQQKEIDVLKNQVQELKDLVLNLSKTKL